MSATGTFRDWAGEAIAYRTRATRVDENAEPGHWITVELDPHGVGQWEAWGRGATTRRAIDSAQKAWNDFDRSTT